MERTHTCNSLNIKDNKSEVVLIGWARRLRDHGGKKFIDLMDREGLTQVVFDPEVTKDFNLINNIKREYLLQIKGKVRPRPEGTINEKLITGEIEIIVDSFSIISECNTLPFELDEETFKNVNDELRLEYRYLDLRRAEMFNILKNRHRFLKIIRDILHEKGFLEFETPNLTKSSP